MAFNSPKPKGFVEEMDNLSVDDEQEMEFFEKIDGKTAELSDNVSELLSPETRLTDDMKLKITEFMKAHAKELHDQAEAYNKYLVEHKLKHRVKRT